MKYLNLDNEEKELLEEFEREEWQSSKEFKKDKRRVEQLARQTLNKTKNINIRVSLHDLEKIKAKAVENGLPYQTLISTIIHYYVRDKIKITI